MQTPEDHVAARSDRRSCRALAAEALVLGQGVRVGEDLAAFGTLGLGPAVGVHALVTAQVAELLWHEREEKRLDDEEITHL